MADPQISYDAQAAVVLRLETAADDPNQPPLFTVHLQMHILALRILATGPLGLRRAVNASNDVRIWATKTGDESPEVSVFAVQVWYSDHRRR